MSAVEVTPEHAVEIAYDKCRTQETSAIREQFPAAANDPTSMDSIRSKVRDGIKASLVKRVAEDRAADPELHAQFADKVREDERRQSADVAGLMDRAIGPCESFRASAPAAPNQLAVFVKGASSPGLITSLAGSLGPFKIDFPKDEFISTEAYNQQRQSKWLARLAGGRDLIIRKTLDSYDVTYDADRGVVRVKVGSPLFDSLRPAVEGVSLTLDYKIVRPRAQFRGGLTESVELEVPATSIRGETRLGSRTIEIAMRPEQARRFKANAVLALQVTVPIADDPGAIVLFNDVTKHGEAFKGDPRGSLHNKKSYPVTVSCAALFSGGEYISDVARPR